MRIVQHIYETHLSLSIYIYIYIHTLVQSRRVLAQSYTLVQSHNYVLVQSLFSCSTVIYFMYNYILVLYYYYCYYKR